MKILTILGAALFAASLASPAHADPLSGLVGKKRPLLLFAKSRSDAGLDKQIDLLRERRPDFSERDMLALVTAGTQDTMAAIGYFSLPPGSNRALHERFAPAENGLTIILVGKDGREKGRWQERVEPDEIFKLVDSMPTRQQEMQDSPATN